MANNVLDMLGRAVLRIGGMSPQQIRQQSRANRTPKPMPKANTSRPAQKPTAPPVTRRSRVNGRVVSGPDTRGNRPIPPNRPPAAPAPGSIQPRGQTNLFAQNGNPRNFRNPATAANRPPTLSPVPQRGGQATPPNRPAGGFGTRTPGQGNLDFRSNSQIVRSSATSRTAPRIPAGGGRPPAGGGLLAGLRGGIGRGLGAVGTGLTIASVLGAIRDAKDGYDQAIRQANLDKTLPQMTPAQNARAVRLGLAQPKEGGGYTGQAQAPGAAAPRTPSSPARSTPVHAAPAQLRQAPAQQALAPAPVQPQAAPARPSAYAPQAGQAPRPNTPQPAAQQQQPFFEQVVPQQRPAAAQPQPMSPQYGGNDEPGRLGQSEGGYAGQVRQPSPVGPVSDGGDYGHMVQATRSQQAPANENGIDMERRRAFLDADNSLDGMAAVRELLKRRKLSISVSD